MILIIWSSLDNCPLEEASTKEKEKKDNTQARADQLNDKMALKEAERFMRRSIELSAKGAREGGAPFGAVVVKNGEIVGEGHNVVVRSRDPTAHGEVVAIRDACKNLSVYDLAGCELYTSCEPCAMCTSITWLCHFDKLYYGACVQDACSMEEMFREVGSHVEKRSIPAERLCAEEAYQVFEHCMEQKLSSLPVSRDTLSVGGSARDKVKVMHRAIELSAIGAKEGGQPFGAVVVKDEKIVGEGHSLVEQSFDPSAHGEVVAIREACKALNTWDLTGCELYTSCEPCAMCTSVIWLCNFSKIYYANSLQDADKYHASSSDEMFRDVASHVEKRSIPAERLCADEALEVITWWREEMGSKVDLRLGVAVVDQ